MAALLEESLRELRLRRSRRRHALELRWMFADEPGYVFSFVSICQALDLDAEAIRRHVLHDEPDSWGECWRTTGRSEASGPRVSGGTEHLAPGVLSNTPADHDRQRRCAMLAAVSAA